MPADSARHAANLLAAACERGDHALELRAVQKAVDTLAEDGAPMTLDAHAWVKIFAELERCLRGLERLGAHTRRSFEPEVPQADPFEDHLSDYQDAARRGLEDSGGDPSSLSDYHLLLLLQFVSEPVEISEEMGRAEVHRHASRLLREYARRVAARGDEPESGPPSVARRPAEATALERLRRGCCVLSVSDVEDVVPPGWVVIERDDEAGVFECDEEAARWLVGSTVDRHQALWVDADTGELAAVTPASEGWATRRRLRVLVPIAAATSIGVLVPDETCPLCGAVDGEGCLPRCPSASRSPT